MKYGDIRLIGIFVKYDQYTIYVSKVLYINNCDSN